MCSDMFQNLWPYVSTLVELDKVLRHLVNCSFSSSALGAVERRGLHLDIHES